MEFIDGVITLVIVLFLAYQFFRLVLLLLLLTIGAFRSK
jgi:hypothetical protein